MHVEPEQPRNIILGTMILRDGIFQTASLKHNLWARRQLTHLVSTICMVMYGNGATTGGRILIQRVALPTLQVRKRCLAAAVGSLMLAIASQPFATATRRTVGAPM